MAGFWDTKLKQLMLQAPKEVVSWLLNGALFEQELSPHLLYRNVDADLLYQIRLNDQPMLLHLEFRGCCHCCHSHARAISGRPSRR